MNLNHYASLHKFDLSECNFTIMMLLADFDLMRLEEFLPWNYWKCNR